MHWHLLSRNTNLKSCWLVQLQSAVTSVPVSARIHTGLTADCTILEIGDFPINPIPDREQKHNQLLMTRPAFGGNTIATIACPDNRPQMATVRPGVMQKAERVEGAKAVIEEFNPGFVPNNKYVEILDIVKAVSMT